MRESHSTHIPSQRSHWIFQANPERYDIHSSLQRESEEYWNLRQHWRDIKKWDEVYIWLSGADAGIYARGVVVTDPELRSDSAEGQQYWSSAEEGKQPRSRVLVQYQDKFLDRPLLRKFLVHEPILSCMSILMNPRGTNFRLAAHERDELESWLRESRLWDGSRVMFR